MSPYFIFFLIFVGGAFAEIFLRARGKSTKWLLLVELIFLACILCLRYGQGTDYMGYAWVYHETRELSLPVFFEKLHRGIRFELIWYLMLYLLGQIPVPYPFISAGVAVIVLLLTYRFLKIFCGQYACLALALLYPGYFLIFQVSAIRQGLIMAIFLGGLLPLFRDRKWVRYYLLAVCCYMIHTTALVYFLVPLAVLLRPRWLEIATVGTGIFAVIRQAFRPGISVSAFLLRIGIYAACAWMYYHSTREKLLTNIYSLMLGATIGYFLLSYTAFYASRFYEVVRYADLILVIAFLTGESRNIWQLLLSLVLMIYASGLTVKNLEASTSFYKPEITAWNYPYITIFNREDLWKYRDDTKEWWDEKVSGVLWE